MLLYPPITISARFMGDQKRDRMVNVQYGLSFSKLDGFYLRIVWWFILSCKAIRRK